MLRNNPERRAYGDAYGWAHLAIDPSGWTVRASAADNAQRILEHLQAAEFVMGRAPAT